LSSPSVFIDRVADIRYSVFRLFNKYIFAEIHPYTGEVSYASGYNEGGERTGTERAGVILEYEH